MSVNVTQTSPLLQNMLRDKPRLTTETVTDVTTSKFSNRLDVALERGLLPSEASPESVQQVAELLQLSTMRSSLELLSPQSDATGGVTSLGQPQSTSGLSRAVSTLQAYMANLDESAALVRRTGSAEPSQEPGLVAPEQVQQKNLRLSEPSRGANLEQVIEKAANRYGVEAGLIKAVIKAESNFNPRAVSLAGAQGLMQLMPATARGLGVTDAFDPEQNIMAGTRFLKQLLNRYDGDLDATLAAYNWGPGNVDRRADQLPRETRDYLVKVKQYYAAFVA